MVINVDKRYLRSINPDSHVLPNEVVVDLITKIREGEETLKQLNPKVNAYKEIDARVQEYKGEIILANTGLVITLAMKFARKFHYYSDILYDFIQAGNEAVIKAIGEYNRDKGTRFSTYAGNAIVRAFMRVAYQSNYILPEDKQYKVKKILPVLEKLKVKYGGWNLEELTNELNKSNGSSKNGQPRNKYTQDDVKELLDGFRLYGSIDSLNEKVDGKGHSSVPTDDLSTLSDSIEDPNSINPLDSMIESETEFKRQKVIREVLGELNPREEEIIKQRYGIDMPDGKGRSRPKIASGLNISHELVRQIEIEAMKKLEDPKRKSRLSEFY